MPDTRNPLKYDKTDIKLMTDDMKHDKRSLIWY